VKQLKQILINELKPFIHYEGRYLLCRSVTPADISSTEAASIAQLLVEDPEGRVDTLSLYNYIPPLFASTSSTSKPPGMGVHSSKAIKEGRPEVEAWLPEGTILAIKEPYYSEEGIRSESPTDVVVLNSDSDLLKGVKWATKGSGVGGLPSRDSHTAIEWKDLGNKQFASGDNFRAARSYGLGIEKIVKGGKGDPLKLTEDERSLLSVLYSNRSLALIRMGHFSEALDVSQKSIDLMESEKAIFRAGKASYG